MTILFIILIVMLYVRYSSVHLLSCAMWVIHHPSHDKKLKITEATVTLSLLLHKYKANHANSYMAKGHFPRTITKPIRQTPKWPKGIFIVHMAIHQDLKPFGNGHETSKLVSYHIISHQIISTVIPQFKHSTNYTNQLSSAHNIITNTPKHHSTKIEQWHCI